MVSILRRAVALAGACALLMGCSHSSDEPAGGPKSKLESSQSAIEQQQAKLNAKAGDVAPGSTTDPAGESLQEVSPSAAEQPSPSEEPSPDSPPTEDPDFDPASCVAPVPGAYPCAGRGIPVEARKLTNTGAYGVTTFIMPSRNIGCDVYANGVTCVVESWDTTIYEDFNPHVGGYVTAGVGEAGPAHLGQGADVPSFTGANPGAPAGEVLPYGTVWYLGDYVFSSAESGLTFWNARTGAGALIKRAGFYPFLR